MLKRANRFIDRRLLLGVVTGLIIGLAFSLKVGEVSAESGAEQARGQVIREQLEFEQIAGKPVVDGKVIERSEEWRAGEGVLIAPRVLEWIDKKMGPDDRADLADHRGLHPSGRPWREERYRGPMWRSMLPEGIELYVFERKIPMMGGPEYWLFLHKVSKGEISAEPYVIEGRWMRGNQPVHPPMVERVELDGQGRAEIVFHGYSHNGTVYNAKTDYYLEYLDDLELRPILELDPLLHSVLDDDDGNVHRTLRRVRPNELVLEAYWQNPSRGTGRRIIGRAALKREGIGKPFKIVSTMEFAERADWYLVIGGG